mmetsp:Transcript_27797/g.31858  ORF Transcript_27797/g.31858 Transcript_27797/m.31858 type:complete len:189 (-) Transcript_27797:58-624(-)
MLVDRKVQVNRSKSRAESVSNGPRIVLHQQEMQGQQEEQGQQQQESYHMDCARLPLDVLNVSDLQTDEALNIDTVMEMVQRWWYNCHAMMINHDDDDPKNYHFHNNIKNNDDKKKSRKEDIQKVVVLVENNDHDHDEIQKVEAFHEKKLQRLFKDAAARALLTHRGRHPNRIVHGGASSSAVVVVKKK